MNKLHIFFSVVLVIGSLINSPTKAMEYENPQEIEMVFQEKFDSRKDYHHLYPKQEEVRSLVALCLGSIANDVKDKINTKDPLESRDLIEKEIFPSLEKHGISPECIVQYWNVHTQPTWKRSTQVYGQNNITCCSRDCIIWHDPLLNKINILTNQGNVIGKNIPFKADRAPFFMISRDSEYIAVVLEKNLLIFLNKHNYQTIYYSSLENNITNFEFAFNGKTLFIGFEDGTIKGLVIDAENAYEQKGKWSEFFLKKHEKPIGGLICDPDSSYLFSGDSDYMYKWNIEFSKQQTENLVAEPIKLDFKVTDIRIPDKKFIFFRKPDKSWILYNILNGNCVKADYFGQEDIGFFSNNRLIKYHGNDLFLYDYNNALERKFSMPKDFRLYSNLKANFLLHGTKNKEKNSIPVTSFYMLAEPTLAQLLYKLALESALNKGYTVDLNALLSHPTFETFDKDSKKLLSTRILEGITTVDRGKIAQQFVDENIKPLIENDKSIISVLNDEFLDSYDDETKMLIRKYAQEDMEVWFIQKYSTSSNIEQKTACFDGRTIECFIYFFKNDFLMVQLNDLIECLRGKKDLVSLQYIQKSGISERLQQLHGRPTESVEEAIIQVKQGIKNKIMDTSADVLDSLITNDMNIFYGEPRANKIRKAVKDRIEDLVIEKSQSSQGEAIEFVEELDKYGNLIDLFTKEELEQLGQIPHKINAEKVINSLTELDDCIKFANRLSRMQFNHSMKSDLKDQLIAHASNLYKTKLQKIADHFTMNWESLCYNDLIQGMSEIEYMEKFAVTNRDILSVERTTCILFPEKRFLNIHSLKARIALEAVGTKMRKKEENKSMELIREKKSNIFNPDFSLRSLSKWRTLQPLRPYTFGSAALANHK